MWMQGDVQRSQQKQPRGVSRLTSSMDDLTLNPTLTTSPGGILKSHSIDRLQEVSATPQHFPGSCLLGTKRNKNKLKQGGSI